jgi:polyisoprenoid-binding protein YceI
MSTTALQRVPAGTYALDPVHSTFGFAVTHNGISKFRGQFEQVEAELRDGVLVGTARVDSIKTAIPQLKDHLLSPEFFNTVETPTITFRSSEIQIAGDGSVEVDGELTIRGITRPVTATGTLAQGVNLMGKEVLGLELQATIDRRDYGLHWQAALPTGGNALAWDVTLQVHLELIQA